MELKVKETGPFRNSREAAGLFQELIFKTDEVDRDKEHFWAIGLDTKNRVKYVELVALGSLSSCPVHPREVFRKAIIRGAASILIGHNHPSGDPSPSRDDINITKRLNETGKVIGIMIMNHIIIAGSSYLSLMEKGYMS